MLIAFDKDFAGRKVGDVKPMPDGIAKVLIRKGYASIPVNEPEKKLAPTTVKTAAKNVKK